jgi:hypothetical protein
MLTQVKTVGTIEEARITAKQLFQDGYDPSGIYVLTHEDNRTDVISDITEANQIGITEEGIFTAIANLFRSKGDELRAKMKSVGISKTHADELEERLDEGNIVIIAASLHFNLDENGEDQSIVYHPYMVAAPTRRLGGF